MLIFMDWLEPKTLTHNAKLSLIKVYASIVSDDHSGKMTRDAVAELIGRNMTERISQFLVKNPNEFISYNDDLAEFESSKPKMLTADDVKNTEAKNYIPVIEVSKNAPAHYVGLIPMGNEGTYFVVSHHMAMKLSKRWGESRAKELLNRVYHAMLNTEPRMRPSYKDMPAMIERLCGQYASDALLVESEGRAIPPELVALRGCGNKNERGVRLNSAISRYN